MNVCHLLQCNHCDRKWYIQVCLYQQARLHKTKRSKRKVRIEFSFVCLSQFCLIFQLSLLLSSAICCVLYSFDTEFYVEQAGDAACPSMAVSTCHDCGALSAGLPGDKACGFPTFLLCGTCRSAGHLVQGVQSSTHSQVCVCMFVPGILNALDAWHFATLRPSSATPVDSTDILMCELLNGCQ